MVDKSGQFTFENVPPGAVQLGRESNPPGNWNLSTSLNPVWHVNVDAGKTLWRTQSAGLDVPSLAK